MTQLPYHSQPLFSRPRLCSPSFGREKGTGVSGDVNVLNGQPGRGLFVAHTVANREIVPVPLSAPLPPSICVSGGIHARGPPLVRDGVPLGDWKTHFRRGVGLRKGWVWGGSLEPKYAQLSIEPVWAYSPYGGAQGPSKKGRGQTWRDTD